MIKAFIIIFLQFVILVSAHSREINFKHLTGDDGLISNSIRDIFQDSDGFMWFATADGLCRYDGYSFLNFTYSPSDSATLCNNNVSYIVEDNNENLWIGTRNGLNVLDRETYEIRRATSFVEGSLDFGPILSLCVGANDMLWIGTNYSGLYSLDLKTFELTNYCHSDEDTTSLTNNAVSRIVENQDHSLFVGTSWGLDLFDINTKTFRHMLRDVHIRDLTYYNDSALFIGGGFRDDIYYMWSLNGGLEKKHLALPLKDRVLRSIMDKDGHQWVSVSAYGMIYHDASTDACQHLLFDRFDDRGINSNTVICLYEDRIGNIWLGTFDSGINIFEKRGKGFIHVKDNYAPDGLQSNRVRAIYQDSEDDIWIGTKVDGALSKLNRESLTFTHYRHDAKDKSSLDDNFIFCVTEDEPGYLWVGTGKGLNLFDKKTGKVTHLVPDANDVNSISNSPIYTLLKDGDTLYIGTTMGLDIYNTKTKVFSHNKHDAKDEKSLSLDKVRALFKDSKGDIWVGTVEGLNRYNKRLNNFDRFVHDPMDATSISDNDILCIYEDAKNELWVGTPLGINRMDAATQTFKVYTTEDGLPANSVKGILDDEEGNLWLSTNNGISKFDPVNGVFTNFNIHDGLQGNEFSQYVYCKTSDGEIMFGGTNGFNIFNPKNITDNPQVPEVVLTNLKISNKEVSVGMKDSPLTKHITRCDELILNHNQSDITLEYVALSYISNQKNKYAYRLEGFDNKGAGWNYVGTKREATYTNLSPGNYVFRVKASNNDGYWNNEGVSLTITVLRAPWKSWWAYSIYFILATALVVAFCLYRIKRVREEKEFDLNQDNLKFFINVSHEFRTPLTLILNPIKRILEAQSLQESKAAAQSISFSANKLMNLVNQLLDFRKSDLGLLSLNVVVIDIVQYSRDIFTLFEEVGYSKDLQFSFESTEPSIEAWVDTDKYEKILYNLLSNAIKYTNNGGHITLSVTLISGAKRKSKLLKKNDDHFVEIKIKDTGIGLSSEQVSHVFERFYSGKESRTAVGIGLNYSKSLIELHKGHILVESEIGKGSTFIVRLPLGHSHFKDSELLNTSPSLSETNFDTRYLEPLKYDIAAADTTIDTEESSISDKDRKLPVVLIVEDNRELRKQLCNELSGKYNVKEAINGQEGLEKAEKYFPDLIISDIMMPIMDGVDMCNTIKMNLSTCHIPVILLTAKSLIENKIHGFKMGADEYISKPFHMDMLIIRIENLLVSRRRLKEKFSSSRVILPSKEVTSNNLDEEFLDKVTQIVTDNMANTEFSMDDLRDQVHLSRAGFFNKIKAITSTNPSTFVRNIKLKHSAELLLKGEHSIKEIAYMSGFKSASYFSTCFNELFKQTPASYQKNGGAKSLDSKL